MDTNYNSYSNLINDLSEFCCDYHRKAMRDFDAGRSIWENPLKPSEEIKNFLNGRTEDQLKTIIADAKDAQGSQKIKEGGVVKKEAFDWALQNVILNCTGKEMTVEKIEARSSNLTYHDKCINDIYRHCENSYCQTCKFYNEGKGSPAEFALSGTLETFIGGRTKEELDDIIGDVKKLYLKDKAAGWDDRTTNWIMMDEQQFDFVLQTAVLGYIEKDKITVSVPEEIQDENAIRVLKNHCDSEYRKMFNNYEQSQELPKNVKEYLNGKSRDELNEILIETKKAYLKDKAAGENVINEHAFDSILQKTVLGEIKMTKISVPTEQKVSNNQSTNIKQDANIKQDTSVKKDASIKQDAKVNKRKFKLFR